jgi:ATP-binding cassette subfamily B protein
MHAAQYGLWLLSWWLVGRGAFDGHLERGWLLAWALVLFTLIPFRLAETWTGGVFAIGVGGLLKQRLLFGALRMEPEEIRHEGAGRLLGRVLESDAVESLALGGGFLALVSIIELAAAATILIWGAGGGIHAAALVAWTALAFGLAGLYARRRRLWTASRLTMTHDLVERMTGHRTRLAQEPRSAWHDGEDEALETYLGLSRAADRAAAGLLAVIPRGWLIVGVVGIIPGFVSGSAAPPALAVALGGVLLAHRALEKLAAGLSQLTGAWIAWEQVAPLFRAAARPSIPGAPLFAVPAPADPAAPRNVIEARELTFRYRDRGDPVLRGCGLTIRTGDRCLLEGPSGGGKSTLASLLVGLRVPESGLLLLGGLDRRTLGLEGWRRRIVAAPQFHENHVLTGTFAFNLLMGRAWPPEQQDFEEADKLCRELGLGELLDRMPAGLLQMVGETGWQLSHGERSRLFIARALLQRSEVIVLDESFAALDPATLGRAMRCVLDRAKTLVVIAHP